MADELAKLKTKYEADQKSWVDDKKAFEGDRDESEKRMETWKERCLD